ncbi:endonuclease/exonuclease/phosphatase family protein [Paenibacillus allorhizosphaerae]|uniref:BIG2 domain-containing protein n=1 Tax=Paenibacillus allorhizosphaerae TaxID=2849866 RepID=A0ABM8VCU1_9BACL|nr:endonuclease/exonuclease/phosphatase family protein [Paenibacillus allorhizosphaerae]CAG7625068.1 hypothetical protein PAECIP111802_01127 [Paenibacillus allorhizosphaerae]
MNEGKRLIYFRCFLINVIVLLLLTPMYSAVASSAPGSSGGGGDAVQPPLKLKAMSYQINSGKGTDNVVDLDRIADVIRSSGADVIGLQAVDKHYSSRSNYEDQAKRIADALGMHYVYGPTVDLAPEQGRTERRQFGMAILSKYPIENAVLNPISNSGTEKRALFEARINVNGTAIHFYTTHMDTTAAVRVKQADEIISIVGRQTGPKIVAVYANAVDTSAEVKRLLTSFSDAFFDQTNAYTNPAYLPTKRISYLLPSYDWELGEARAIPSLASIHLPIVSELILNPDAHANPALKALAFTDKALSEMAGNVMKVKLNAYYTNGTVRDATYSAGYVSSHPEVADVPSPGLIRAKSAGKTVVTATYGPLSADLPVSVYLTKNADLASIRIDGVPVESFAPDRLFYRITVPRDSTKVPAISAQSADANASVTVFAPTTLPGIAYLVVTADDGATTKEYRVQFTGEKTDLDMPLKVMSFNIHHGADSDENYDLEKTADVIRQSGAEVIGLQEVDRYYSSRSNLEDTIGRLAEMLGMHYAYGANLDRAPQQPGLPNSQYGTAVLSKYPILEQRNYALTSYGQEQRGLLETRIDMNAIPLYFYSTHLGLDAVQQQTQTDEILAIAGEKDGPKIIVGDFNARPYSPDMRRIAAAFQEPFASQPNAYTIDSKRPYAKIDYIWASDKLLLGDAERAQVIQTQVSDHLPIVGDLYVKRELNELNFSVNEWKTAVGSSMELKATGLYSGGYSKDVTAEAQYASSNEAAVRVEKSGAITAIAPGTAQITARLGEQVATMSVYVMGNRSDLASISVNGLPLQPFLADRLDYTVYLPEGATMPQTVTAQAYDAKAIVTVEQAQGVPGEAVITVTAEDGIQQTVYRVHFEQNTPVSLVLNPAEWHAAPGEEMTLKASLRYKDGSLRDMDDKVRFSHSNGSVASVNAHGRVKAHRSGSAVINASVDGFQAEMTVQVEDEGNEPPGKP